MRKTAPAPFVWDVVRYCLILPEGSIRHFPAGTYDGQMANTMGKVELNLMTIVHSVWYAFEYLGPSKWGDGQRRLAKWMMPKKMLPTPPTRRLDDLIMRLWPDCWRLRLVMKDIMKDIRNLG